MNRKEIIQLFQQVKHLKVWAAVLLLTVPAVACFVEAYDNLGKGESLTFPFEEVGWHLIELLFIVLLFELFIRKQSEETMREQLLSPEVIRTAVSDERIVQIMRACFWKRTQSEELAHDLVEMATSEMFVSKNRRYGMSVDVALYPLGPVHAQKLRNNYVGVSVEIKFSMIPTSKHLRFAVAPSREEYIELSKDPSFEFAWYFYDRSDYDEETAEAFSVEKCELNGSKLVSKRCEFHGCRVSEFTLPDMLLDGQRHDFKYVAKYLKPNKNVTLVMTVDKPTFGVFVSFDYSRVSAEGVTVHESLTSVGKPVVTYYPDDNIRDEAHRVIIELKDNWIIPRSDIVFAWRTPPQSALAVNVQPS